MNAEEYRVSHAEASIDSQYGVSVSVAQKKKTLLKFGRNAAVSNSVLTTIMTLPTGIVNETYVASNLITHFASATGADTQTLTIEGHTISGSNFTFSTQNVTLVGQTKTALTTPLARCTRMYNSNQNKATTLIGNVYVAEDVTFTAGVPASAVHCMISAGANQSTKASTTLSSSDYWLVMDFHAHNSEKTSGRIAVVLLEIREPGGVFRLIEDLSVSAGTTETIEFEEILVVPKNSDIRLRAIASSNGQEVGGTIQGYLAN